MSFLGQILSKSDLLKKIYYKTKNYSPSPLRKEGNDFFYKHGRSITGTVYHCGAQNDFDKMGRFYKWYFPNAKEYTTLDIDGDVDIKCDLTNLDMIQDNSVDGILCPWVLEHIEATEQALSEMLRILKPGGRMIFGVPAAVGYHGYPHDYWRFSFTDVGDLFKSFDLHVVEKVGPFEEAHWKGDERLKWYGSAASEVPHGWVGVAIKPEIKL